MPSSKRKHLPINRDTPGCTLHDFFPAKPVTTQLQCQPPKLRNSKSRRRTTSANTSSKQEVIVIDSDSDDTLEIVEGTSLFDKRRKLNPKNSDGDLKSSIHSKGNCIPYIQRVEGQTISFGRPFLLCSSPEENDDKAKQDNHCSLGARSTQSFQVGLASSSLACSKVDIDPTLDGWDDGDDEVAIDSMANDFLDKATLQNELELEWQPVSRNLQLILCILDHNIYIGLCCQRRR